MHFELTPALSDSILFAMEDFGHPSLLDSEKALVVPAEAAADEVDSENPSGRYLSLPQWGSADGYRIMEGFAASVRSPAIRMELVAALNRGKGVFRAFKDVLSAHPEAEKLWFVFKRKELNHLLLAWYNALREEWGLEAVGEEPEETDDLLLEDFVLRKASSADEDEARSLHASIVAEAARALSPLPVTPLFPPDSDALVAETERGDFAGFILSQGEGGAYRIVALDVAEAWRGLGLAEELLSRLVARIKARGGGEVRISLPVTSGHFARVLSRRGFSPRSTEYSLTTD